jgi:hypothetical protein
VSPSRDDAQIIAELERENHKLRVELETARRRAAAWRRVAQWIHQAHQPEE